MGKFPAEIEEEYLPGDRLRRVVEQELDGIDCWSIDRNVLLGGPVVQDRLVLLMRSNMGDRHG